MVEGGAMGLLGLTIRIWTLHKVKIHINVLRMTKNMTRKKLVMFRLKSTVAPQVTMLAPLNPQNWPDVD